MSPTDMSGRAIYSIRKSGSSFSIGVPVEFGSMIPEGAQFVFKVTEAGFCYEPFEGPEPEGMPEWVHELQERHREH